MLFQPLFLLPVTIILVLFRVEADHPPAWLGKARIAALITSVYVIGAPFLLSLVLNKSIGQVRARGIDPDGLLALLGIAGSILPMACGLALVVCGDRVEFLYIGWITTLAAMGYWSWRQRALLFPSRPPVVESKEQR